MNGLAEERVQHVVDDGRPDDVAGLQPRHEEVDDGWSLCEAGVSVNKFMYDIIDLQFV